MALASGWLAIIVAVSGAGGAAASDPDCPTRLWAVPIETVTPPEGWQWRSFDLLPDGLYGGLQNVVLGHGGADVFLSCSPDAAAYLSRTKQLQGFLASTWGGPIEALSVVPIGDESHAYRYGEDGEGWSHLKWRHGDIVAKLSFSDAGDQDDFVSLALTIDALLPEPLHAGSWHARRFSTSDS